jgi:hypothetical protein
VVKELQLGHSWANVTQVIDAARGCQAEVILMTDKIPEQ